ncbi:MAG: hypothetical protein QM751_02535 [Paludibacteraceae bacterium]
MESKNDAKEINLLHLLGLIGDWVAKWTKKFFGFLGLSLQLIIKHWLISISVLIISVAIGQFLARPTNQKYKAGAIAMLYGPKVETANEVCRQLQNSIGVNGQLSLKYKLGLPDSVLKNVVGINKFKVIDYLKDGSPDAVDFNNSHSLSDTANLVMQDRFYFQLITKKVSQLPMLQQAVLKYFNENQTMKGEFEIGKKSLEEKIKVCDNEINRLDSLAKVTYFKDADKKISFEDNRLVVGEQRKQLFYNDILQLQDIKSYTKYKLSSYDQPLDFLSGLVVDPEAINSQKKCLIYSLLIAISVSVTLSFLVEYFKVICDFLTKRK